MSPIPPPRPGKPPRLPQPVGEGDSQSDVAKLTDRGVAIKALDLALRLQEALKRQATELLDARAAILKDVTAHDERLKSLERFSGDFRQSRHDWDEILAEAGHKLSKRVKDPRDRLDSDRARQIAAEVLETSKVASEAKAFRAWKSGGAKILVTIAKAGAVFAAGGLGHWLWQLVFQNGGH